MSSALNGRDFDAFAQRKDLPSQVIDLQNDVARLKRDVAQGGQSLGWSVTTPAMPATGVGETNTYRRPVTVYVRGGTVTNITIGGQALGMTSGTFRVAPDDEIAITYSVAPTWFWYGD